MNNIVSKEPSKQFQNLLKLCCSTEEQKQFLRLTRKLVLINENIKEFPETRHIIYGKQKSKPYIEIICKQEWTLPKLVFTLPKITKLNQVSSQNCRYGIDIDASGNFSEFLTVYKIRKLQPTRQCRLSIILKALGYEQIIDSSNNNFLETLIKLTITHHKFRKENS